MKKTAAISFLFALVSVSAAQAKDCVLEINRTACSEELKEKALAPYKGQNPTKEEKDLDEVKCKAEGEKVSKIIRKGTLKEKTATVLFKGKEVGKYTDKAECK